MNNTATILTGGQHGTKWAGILTIASSILSGIDPSTLPPSWLPYIGAVLGAITFARGFVNTANAAKKE
jgi:hypothetical protein